MKPRNLLPALASRRATQVFHPPSPGFFSARDWDEIAQLLDLSDRQLQLVRAVFEDQTEDAIASSLGISVHTVHTHFERLRRKLRVTNRVQLVLRVLAVLPMPPGGHRTHSAVEMGRCPSSK